MKNKIVKAVLIIAISFFPLKWFVFTTIYNSFKIAQLNREDFIKEVNKITGCEAGDNIYGLIDCHNQYDTAQAKTGVGFSTKNSQYYFIEEGAEPIWKSCLYKVEGSSKELVSLPGNCHYWTWFHIGASKDSENLIVYQYGYGTYQYVVKDDRKIFRYFKPDPSN